MFGLRLLTAISALVVYWNSSSSAVAVGVSLSCLDEKGSPVDSWVALKQPAGSYYYYYDSATQQFHLSPYSMNDTANGALTWTTQQLWNSATTTYTIFNDEVPGETSYSYTYGHTKGYFALADDDTGFYITHSIPLYPVGPSNSSTYLGLGSNAWTYAQNAACLTVSGATLDAMAYKFHLNRPLIYDSRISTSATQKYSNIASLVGGYYSTAAICANSALYTSGGMGFAVFAKSTQWNNDLWSGCVSSIVQSALYVESWIRGSQEPAYCPSSGFDVLDVSGVDFSSSGGGSYGVWSETKDHSKWAVSLDNSTVCFGDINRMSTQYGRGGGTVCYEDSVLGQRLLTAVTGSSDACTGVAPVVPTSAFNRTFNSSLRSVATCGSSTDLAKNLMITLSPSDPKPGDTYTTITEYDLDVQITGGTATYKATLSGFPIVNQKDDLCTDLATGTTPCLLGPGHIHSEDKSTVPTGVHGNLVSSMIWTNSDGRQILCLEFHFSL